MISRHLRLLLIAVVPSLTAAFPAFGAVGLVVDGRPHGRIVVPAAPTEGEQFTAEELQTYIRKVSGATLPIVASDDPGDGPAIIVGNHALNRPVVEALARRHPDKHEALAVVAAGARLHLAGASETGRLYAAWDWIENELGVRWFFPTEQGEYVPERRTIRIEPIEKYDAPHVDWRACSVWTTSAQQEAEQRYGRMEHGLEGWRLFRYRSRNSDAPKFARQDGWYSLGGAHAYRMFLPVEKYGKEHPDWYNQLNGRQPPEKGAQVNFTNPAAAEQYARNAIGYVQSILDRGIPPERVLIWNGPADGVIKCELPGNRALIDDDGSGTSMMVHFGNAVAEHVRAEYPKATVVHHVYSNHATPPDKVKPLPGTGAVLSHWCGGDSFAYNHAEPGFSDGNAKYRSGWNTWVKLVDKIGIYCYYGHYGWPTPFPMITQMANDFPLMADSGKFRYIQGQLHGHWGTQGLTFYLLSKLAWDPYLDVDRVVHDYCEKGFGPAGPAIERYLRVLQAGMDELSYVSGSSIELAHLLTPGLIEQCNTLIDEAESHLPAMDPATRWRTTIVTRAWRASAQIGEAGGLFIRSRDRADLKRIRALHDQAEEIIASDWGILAFDTRIARKCLNAFGRRALSVPLHALPPGTHEYYDNLPYGGATKFFAHMDGFDPGRWGLYLGVHRKGAIDLPVGATTDHVVTKMTLRLDTHHRNVSLRVRAGSDQANLRTITDKLDDAGKGVSIPADLLGGPKVVLRIEAENHHANPVLVLTGLNLDITVE